MEATKFEALSIQDAIKLVKQELGKDAVIISTKHSERTLPGNRIQKFYEVLATPAVSKKSMNSSSQQVVRKPEFPKIRTNESPTIVRGTSSAAKLAESASRLKDNLYDKSAATDRSQSIKSPNATASPTLSPKEYLGISNALTADIDAIRQEMKRLPHIDLSEQIQEVKVLLHEIIRSKSSEQSQKSNHHSIDDICLKLRVSGVSPSTISELQNELERVSKTAGPEAHLDDLIFSSTIKFMLRCLKVSPTIFQTDGGQGIHCFIGSSGVGKTSSLAKVAASLNIKQNQKVCLVNFDNQRLGSSDQLRVYSKILGMEFLNAETLDQLHQVVEKAYQFDTILIDTSGRSAMVRDQIEMVTALQESRVPYNFHLVVSATTKQRDIDESIRAYRQIKLSSIIYSKIDESWTYGEMLNTSTQFGVPISFFATGPGIPEDLEPATKERIIERLLKI